MNTTNQPLTQIICRKMNRIQDAFRELEQEDREILLNFLNKKYCSHPDKFNKYNDKYHNDGICKLCDKKWKLYLTKNQVTTLQYYDDISELEESA